MPASGLVAGTVAPVQACIAVYGGRDRIRSSVRAAFPKRRARLVLVRSTSELRRVLCSELVDAALVDVGGGAADAWLAAGLARSFASVPFVAVAPLRASEGEMLSRCVALGVADVLVDGVDDAAVKGILTPLLFTSRFAVLFGEPPPELGLASPLQRSAWACIVEAGGRMTRTAQLSAALGVTREHLSRRFGQGAPSLKAVIDLVRLIVAAELARNPGHQVRDIAAILGFATPSHFARTTTRIAGRPPSALIELSIDDLIAHFVERHAADRRGRRAVAPPGGNA